jgi:hypothetical protein
VIKTIFPVNVVIKDHILDDSWNEEIKTIVLTIFKDYIAKNNVNKSLTDDEIPLFTENNLNKFPILRELQDLFVNGFYELASSYNENILTKDMLKGMVSKNSGKLPFVKTGERKSLHNHIGASAFGVFYLNSIDNKKHGGELILRDPAFHSNLHFHPPETFSVETKRNRLVVAPAYIWHEVNTYTGSEDRLAVVINLDI